MNNPDHDSNVCVKDGYGNVTAKKQAGNDIRNEKKYKGFTLDIGAMVVVWKPDDSWFGKFPDVGIAKAGIDATFILPK